MSNEKAIAAALEPILDDLLALEKRVDGLRLQSGPKGDAGNDADPAAVARVLAADAGFVAQCRATDGVDGEDGSDGNDGAGIDAPQWKAGEVYRNGTVVVAYIGQHYVATKDTAGVPGESDHWRRVGAGGFRHRGTFDKDAAYVDGDLFVKDWGTFCIVHGAPVMLAGRGAAGPKGEPGARGAPGANGRDGSTIIGAQVQGFNLVLVQQNADGSIDHLEADFAPAFRALVREAVSEMLGVPA